MTEYMLKIGTDEADAITKGDKGFIFRNSKYHIGYGDRITFVPYKAGKPTRHCIEHKKYTVTYVSSEAPVEQGWSVIGIKPC